ncbi:MAG: hypothetical protein LBE79_07705 [Tannerella sp.]|nr:hypothetical protein [Tannerella sp.]
MGKQFFGLFIFTVLFNVLGVYAQGQRVEQRQQSDRQSFNRNEFLERRNAFLVAEMTLSTDEAKKFIPLENEFKQKSYEVGRECRRLAQQNRDKKKMTDDESQKMIDCHLNTRIKEAQLEKEYFEQFKKVLKPEKIYKYLEADAKFSRELANLRRTTPERNNQNRPTERNNNQNRPRNQE